MRAIGTKEKRADMLSAWAQNLAEPERSRVMAEALKAAWEIKDNWSRAKVLSRLTAHLGEPERSRVITEILTAARAIEDGDEQLGTEGSDFASRYKSWKVASEKPEVLIRLTPYLAEPERSRVMAEALTAVQAIEDATTRAEVLRSLIPYLDEQERSHVMTEALTAAQAIEDATTRAGELSSLIPYLDEQARSHVLMRY
jgi:hypothetical protein